jgi:hypothetical protein
MTWKVHANGMISEEEDEESLDLQPEETEDDKNGI